MSSQIQPLKEITGCRFCWEMALQSEADLYDLGTGSGESTGGNSCSALGLELEFYDRSLPLRSQVVEVSLVPDPTLIEEDDVLTERFDLFQTVAGDQRCELMFLDHLLN